MPKTLTVLGIAVNDQVRLAQREAIHGVDELAGQVRSGFVVLTFVSARNQLCVVL